MCTSTIAWLALATADPDASAAAVEHAPASAPIDEARAQPPAGQAPVYRTVVDAPEPSAQRSLDARSPGFATAIDLQDEVGARPSDALPELLARTPGATVRSLGGLGQFASVSVRGSAPQQVAMFLDGVPIDAGVAGLVDLGSIPLDGLSRVEVYRGHVPIELGGAAIGGAIDLVGADAGAQAGAHVAGGIGSFGARQSKAGVRLPIGRGVALGAVLGYAGADGDYPFHDDGGTPTLTGDDRVSRRTGNGYDRVADQLRVDVRRGRLRASVQQLGVFKHQQIPGRGSVQARHATLSTTDVRTTARVVRDGLGRPGGSLSWVGGVGVQRLALADPRGEVGLSIDDQRTIGVDTYVSPRLRLALWRDAFLRLAGDQRVQWVRVTERAPTPVATGDATRVRAGYGAGVAIEQFLWRDRWLVVPGLRVDAIDSRFAAPAGEGEVDDAGRDAGSVGLSPRIGTRLRLATGVELRASLGRYFRPPTLLELFGDRGTIVGNEGLSPERGTAIDGGLVLDLPLRSLALYAQLAGFSTTSRDLIQWIAAGPVTRPENLAAAAVHGVEASASIVPTRRIVTLHVDYTWTHSENRSDDAAQRGRPLPGRPEHDLFVRGSAGRELTVAGLPVEPRVAYLVDVVSGTFLDPSGRLRLPTRALQGIAAELSLARRAHVAFEVRNLLDVRTAVVTLPVAGARPTAMAIADVLGYPLPGRSLWATLRLDLDVQPRARRQR